MVSHYSYHGDAFVAGKPSLWCDFQTLPPPQPPFDSNIIDVGPDGKRFAVLVPATPESQKPPTQVSVLLNFSDELQRKINSAK